VHSWLPQTSVANELHPDQFAASLSAAIARAERESVDDVGTLLVRQIAVLQMLGRLLAIDYREFYQSEQADAWLKLLLYTEALYQQLHATVTTAAVLVGERASPPLGVRGLSQLKAIADAERHPVAADLRHGRREIDLLRWCLQVRNTAIQHRAEAGYVGGRSVVLPDAFALLHAAAAPPQDALRKANDLLVGLHRRYGNHRQERVDSREAVTYLDLFSHSILQIAPADFDAARRVVAEARAFDVVVSRSMLQNVDDALAVLIGFAPPHPNRVGP